MKTHVLFTCLVFLFFSDMVSGQSEPDAKRIQELARLLPDKPRGVGPTIDDRALWRQAANAPGFQKIISDAENLLDEQIPELPDDLYLDFSRTGNRTRWQNVARRRHGRVPLLVLAECLENKGRFLPAIEESIHAMCLEKTWVMPAHDRSLKNFRGETVEIDLMVAGESWTLATAYYWLGRKLSGEVRELISDELERRTFKPFEGMVKEGKPHLWWLTCTNNWNAVCLAGVTGAALAMIESPERRAFFVAAAEKNIQYFLSGFTPDGYCSEGLGYWNYGFGHYVMLAETIIQATGGKIDLLDNPKVEKIAHFSRRMEMTDGIYPAFADCRVDARPDVPLLAYLSRRYGMGLEKTEALGLGLKAGPTTSLFGMGIFRFPGSVSSMRPRKTPAPPALPRDWFEDAGILICRPVSGGESSLAAALKGGHNGEHHNHNDVGSFLVAVGGGIPLVDPGAETYTSRTFSGKRYDSKVLNSFGHPVPRVAGKLQRTGRNAAAVVLDKKFTAQADTFVLDLRNAYDVKGLLKLNRTFSYSRKGKGRLVVIDEVAFESSGTFGTALTTFSKWSRPDPGRFLVGEGPARVQVEITVEGGEMVFQAKEIHEDLPGGRIPVRLGFDLKAPVRKGIIKMTITPSLEDGGS